VKTGKIVSFEPLSGTPLEILESGGILHVLKRRVEKVSDNRLTGVTFPKQQEDTGWH
jgi:hypothetical protein